jgi:FixJ family two-component response regulator
MARLQKAKSDQGGPALKSLVSVVDDDESVRESIAGLLNWLGLRVKAFSTALEFLASPELSNSSCVIADVHMPQMTGIELYGRVRALGHDVPTILITAFPDDEARTHALAAGVVCYLSKPFDKDDLIGCIRTALRSRLA